MAVFISLATTALPAAVSQAADSAAPPQVGPQIPGQEPEQKQDDTVRQIEKEQRKRANTDRHAQLKRDTDRLLQLATELKQAVDKSNEHTLSLDVIKKADQIEKLAKSVREKMKAF